MKTKILVDDTTALLVLAQDDDYATRSMASILIDCLNNDVEVVINNELLKNLNSTKKARLIDVKNDASQRRIEKTSCIWTNTEK